jgi:hypothetical protein
MLVVFLTSAKDGGWMCMVSFMLGHCNFGKIDPRGIVGPRAILHAVENRVVCTPLGVEP